jgi:hypothetical protein
MRQMRKTIISRRNRLERGCVQSTSRSMWKGSAASGILPHTGFSRLLRLVCDTAALRGNARMRQQTVNLRISLFNTASPA